MTIRNSFRIVLWAIVAMAAFYVALVVWVAWQNQMAREEYESSKAAGLAATTPPQDVGFEIVSMWQQQPGLFGHLSGLITPEQAEATGGFIQPLAVPAGLPPAHNNRFNTESYDSTGDNPFIAVAVDPRATFSVDVDTASYANMRRFVMQGQRPPKDSVRIEELINYFTYDYPPPASQHPIAVLTEIGSAPWQPDHRLVRVAIKAKSVDMSNRPTSNLVFLIDVSGSMDEPAKLPLLKSSIKLLIDNLGARDRIAVVVYAGSEGLVLPSTTGDQKATLYSAIESLFPGGSTNGAAGIQLAYDIAAANFINGGINRVVLATDGDFNVGVTSEGELVRLIEDRAKSGVFLSVLGFGMGNLKDSTLEKLADKGNGNYAYIDTLNEARKVLVREMGGTLVTVAKDVKIQVEFNPNQVRGYRLIGYENRVLRHEDFNNDERDAGEMGSGHTVTALFEVVPAGVEFPFAAVDPLKYQRGSTLESGIRADEMLNLKVRYKEPSGDASHLMESPVIDRGMAFQDGTADFRFAAAVASFGMILRDSPYKGHSTLDAVLDIAEASRGSDDGGYRDQFIQLVTRTRALND